MAVVLVGVLALMILVPAAGDLVGHGPIRAILAVLATALGVALFGFLLVAAFVAALLRQRPVTRSRSVRGQLELEETRLLQEINRSLDRMNSRIESLETIVLDKARTPDYGFQEIGRRA
jgi:hypothetical protein